MKSNEKKEHEKKIIKEMIKIYCTKNHHQKDLCDECLDLYTYATKRIDCCPFTETKSFCSACKVHCYQKKYRHQVRQVMRFSGKYMLFYHPVMTIKHGLVSLKERRNQHVQ